MIVERSGRLKRVQISIDIFVLVSRVICTPLSRENNLLLLLASKVARMETVKTNVRLICFQVLKLC